MSNSSNTILQEIEQLKVKFKNRLKLVKSATGLQEFRTKYLGRKGELAHYFKKLSTLSQEDRPKVGQVLNNLKSQIENAIEEIASS
ncbi:MAG: hypothetical protein ACE5NG_18120, partial [bacterium]